MRKGHQVMVFVHARNATVRTGLRLKELAQMKGHSDAFLPENSSTVLKSIYFLKFWLLKLTDLLFFFQYGLSQKAMSKSRNKQLVELFNSGFACHHAGMLRGDRSLVEKLFSQGHIKVGSIFKTDSFIPQALRFSMNFSMEKRFKILICNF